MHELLSRPTGWDRRSIDRSEEVVAAVLGEPSLFGMLVSGLINADRLIRMRAADALEKVMRQHPEWLQPFKGPLLCQVAQSQEQEVSSHVPQLFPRLRTSQEERAAMVALLLDYLGGTSRIVKTFALQALADLAEQDATLRHEVIHVLEEQTRTGSPAMQSRDRNLLRKLTATSASEESQEYPNRLRASEDG